MRERFLWTVILTVYTTSSLGLTDCSQEEFQDIRQTYEECANEKIANITLLLQNGNLGNSQDMVICEQVKQLINHCGDLLYKCFHLDQVWRTIIVELYHYHYSSFFSRLRIQKSSRERVFGEFCPNVIQQNKLRSVLEILNTPTPLQRSSPQQRISLTVPQQQTPVPQALQKRKYLRALQ